MKNKKPIIALGALAVVGLIAGTIAYFTSEATFDNIFKTAVYKTKSEEVFNSPDNWTPGDVTPKTITTKNEGTIPVAVRISTSESWKDENDNEISAATLATVRRNTALELGIDGDTYDAAIASNPSAYPEANTVTINLANTSDWVFKNGYYYYNKSLIPNATTTTFMESVTLNAALKVDKSCTEPVVDQQDPSKKTITCSTSIAGLGKATYTLTLTVETVQFDQYDKVWFDGVDKTSADFVTIAETPIPSGD